MSAEGQPTPMMGQYLKIKASLPPDTLLLFRLGDFYEMFFDDAKQAAPLLDVTLTHRQGQPMCGVPHHAVDAYLARLIRAGRKVAVCDQMEDPSQAKGIVRREVTRIVTPGSALEEQLLESNRNNYLAGLATDGTAYGLALLDLSTGTFWIEEADSAQTAGDHLARYQPAECVVPAALKEDAALRALLSPTGALRTFYEDYAFDPAYARDLLIRHFKVHSLEGFGCENARLGVQAAGGVLHYVGQELRRHVDHVRCLTRRNASDHMVLDEATIANLDLITSRSAPRAGVATTLLGVLDTTRTAMGGRLLRDWLLRPLCHTGQIHARLDAVEALSKDRALLSDLRERLTAIRDLERLIARLSAGAGNARDVRGLGVSLAGIPDVRAPLEKHACVTLAAYARDLEPLPELTALIARALVDEPPATTREGGMFRANYHAGLDELRAAATEGHRWIAEYQTREQQRTGIASLKVRYNQVFGYYIEITKTHLAKVPEDYRRKQTMANAERFITPELKEYETRVLGAQDRAVALEAELFAALREQCVAETARIQKTAAAVAALDALASLAERARALRYVRPVITGDNRLVIREGRHPVVEQLPDTERFVPNDTLLDGDANQLAIITGPNMAGKSTYIRQVALITIMAHAGSFVPAAHVEIGLVDRVFTRVGASDDLVRGRSTFMVEMQETANILHNATARSLIVLDEIGRGTSTFDGISIAWAVAEYLHNHAAVKAKTLFATHYHELTDLALTMPGVKNYNVLVSERGDRIVFLRKIVPGGADKSYGIQVARLAGLPDEVIERAREILGNLEEGELGETGQPQLAKHNVRRKNRAEDNRQMELFGGEKE